VVEYNKLVAAAPLYCIPGTGASSAHEPVTPEQIFAAEFPWVAEYREGRSYHTLLLFIYVKLDAYVEILVAVVL
jgi:hypothetical protein